MTGHCMLEVADRFGTNQMLHNLWTRNGLGLHVSLEGDLFGAAEELG